MLFLLLESVISGDCDKDGYSNNNRILSLEKPEALDS
jgi:hypothetical protein